MFVSMGNGGEKMKLMDVIKQLDAGTMAKIILLLAEEFESPRELEEHLGKDVSEKELQEINQAALQEGRQPLFFI